MFSLRTNPQYVPGGVENFWLNTANEAIDAAKASHSHSCVNNAEASLKQPAKSLTAWFFTNDHAKVEEPMAIVKKDMRSAANEVKFAMLDAGKELLVKKDAWKLEEINLPKIFKFQQFTQFNDNYWIDPLKGEGILINS